MNVIIGQDPDPGEKRKIIPGKQNCDLKLIVCWGAETFELADYSYTDSREAKIKLTELGLIADIVKETHEYISEGQVIRTSPEPGTTLKRGDHVTLYVSSGQDITYTKVPDFYKCDEQAVMKMLGWSNLKLGNWTYEYSSEVNKGCVISQSRPAEAQVPVNTKIDFVMSLGPQPADEGQ